MDPFRCCWLLSAAAAFILGTPATARYDVSPLWNQCMRSMVQADWERQEVRLGRTTDSPEAIRAALRRARLVLEDLRGRHDVGDLADEAAALDRLTEAVRDIASLDAGERRDLYFQVRTVGRELILRNPSVSGQPIAFMLRHRAVGYMLYEYLGWYYSHGNEPMSGLKNPQLPTPARGGGVFRLIDPGRSMEVEELTAGQLPPGHFVTLALDYDARTIYFAYADPSGTDPYTLSGYAQAPAVAGTKYNTFHIFAMSADGSRLRQLTEGPSDDFDPCPLPDGGIAFESTRRGGKLRCGGGSPELVFTLHRMDADGANVRTLSFHETNEWHPSVLADGRIIYTRWDYVDRNPAKFHGLWTCNPDGSSPSSLFGNYTTRPWACFQAKAIPGSQRIVFIGGGHHANVGGTLLMLDPAKLALDRTSGEDRVEALQCLTPEVGFAEAEGWPKSYFYSPWPLSEKHFLVAFSHDPLPGGYTGEHRDTETGIYYFDIFGNLELLFRREGISAVYPVPLAARPRPPVRVGQAYDELGEQGEFLLADVNRNVLPLPAARPIKELRVFQILPKSRTDQADDPPIGHAGQSNARMLLGTVPVEPDGSAYFRAPARKPLYFQAVDGSGRAVQGMRSVVYLQPGERRGCVGCHEPPGSVAAARPPLAAQRPPSELTPGPDGSRPFSYPRLVQPLLDRHCVRCHDGSTGSDRSELVLTAEPSDPFSRSYDSLQPYLRWPSYDAVTRPGELGADSSPLTATLAAHAERGYVALPDIDRRSLYLWLDAHVPFFGTYETDARAAQRAGRAVSEPALQ